MRHAKTIHLLNYTKVGNIMKTTTNTASIKNIMDGITLKQYIRESYQRTPSHTKSVSQGIIETILSGGYIGIFTLAQIDDTTVNAIIDGSSRLEDISNFISNILPVSRIIDGKKKDMYFKDLDETQKNNFLEYGLNMVQLLNTTIEEREEYFIKLNNSTAMSNIQKNKGITTSTFNDICNVFAHSEVYKNCFTDTQKRKDEHLTVVSNIIANINDCYTSSNKDLIRIVQDESIDLVVFEKVLGMLDNVTKCNKYILIAIICTLYFFSMDNSIEYFSELLKTYKATPLKDGATQEEKRIYNQAKKDLATISQYVTLFDDLMSTIDLCNDSITFDTDTKFTNSAPRNRERLDKALHAILVLLKVEKQDRKEMEDVTDSIESALFD